MRTRWRVFFGLITLAVVIYLISKINFIEVWNLIVAADDFYFLLAFLAATLSFLLYNTRSMYFLKGIVKPDYWFSFETLLACLFVNVITPGAQLGGDPVRAYFLGKNASRVISPSSPSFSNMILLTELPFLKCLVVLDLFAILY